MEFITYNGRSSVLAITIRYLEQLKWFANACMIASTAMMISPALASQSTLPWISFAVANVIWWYDSWLHRNKPWMCMALCFIVWDIAIIIQRVFFN